MHRLLAFPHDEDETIAPLRASWLNGPSDDAAVTLGLALATAGCSYEAGHLLRPLRRLWKGADGADAAQAALDAQTWWNKSWRAFAQARQAGRHEAALSMLGDRAVHFWDMPPVLMHLGAIALGDGRLDLAEHVFRRIGRLAARGLPKMEMAAFRYGAEASLIDVLTRREKFDEALAAYARVTPNPGNAMAHQLQGARLTALSGRHDDAMRRVAEILVTAERDRKGWSRDVRLDFVDNDPSLNVLRGRADWAAMRKDGKAWLDRAG